MSNYNDGIFSFVATVHSVVGGEVGGAETASISSDSDRPNQLFPQGK